VHIAKIPLPQAKLPLPKWEIERTRRHRAILDNLIEKANDAALVLQQEILDEAAARAAARAQAALAPAAPLAAATAPKQAPPPPNRAPSPPQPTQSAPEPPPAPARHHRHANPELILSTLIRTIQSCIRLDAWLADRLHRGHTTAELAGLAHPSRQDILNVLHNAARIANPHEDRSDIHQELETRVSRELALNPGRNPADIIAEICTLFDLPFDDADFPNDWRCESFTPPAPEDDEIPEDPDEIVREYCRLEALHPRQRFNRLE
jgi:hypothetical protein